MTRYAYNNSITAFNPPALFLPTRNIAPAVVCNDWRCLDVGDQRNCTLVVGNVIWRAGGPGGGTIFYQLR